MQESTTLLPTFAEIAPRVMWRVWVRRWLALMGQTVWPVSFALVVVGMVILAAGLWRLSMMGWVMVGAWIMGAVVMVWRSRPREFSALALWDQVTGRREAFAAAWWFERQPAPLTEAARRHIETQRAALIAALPALRRDLPLQPHRWLWLPPVLAVLLTAFHVALRPHEDVLRIDEAMRQTALEEAGKLAQTDWDKKKLEGLNAEEQAQLDQLKDKLKQTAQNLEKAGGKDAREVMSDLERRAREAEKLAERLGADHDAWASDKLVRSLREHADTAELGDALAAKAAPQAAAAAEELAKQLASSQLTNEVRERMNETLQDAGKVAEEADRQRLAGRHVLGAGDRLRLQQAAEAGEEFQKLSDKMRDLARRQQTRKELEKLAEQLRDAGSNIAGQNQGGGMQQMAAAQQGQAGGQAGQVPQVGQAQGGQAQSQQALQPPGLGQMNQTPSQATMMNPIPGTSQPQGQTQQLLTASGQQGQKGQGQPMLMAPIPGAKPGEQPSAVMLGPPGKNAENGPMMAMSAPGGRQAGMGKADLNADPTAKKNTAREAIVAPQQSLDGQSAVRAVEGGTRTEAATRTASQIAIDAIQAEEEALDEATLPPSRRDQVRRYFTELRRRFEKQP